MYSRKLKARSIRKEMIVNIKQERINYMERQISKNKVHYEQLVQKTQNILSSELSVNCICVPYIIETETEQHWVECSRKECKQKWFHYQSVEIIQEPTGVYYCPLFCFIKYQQKLWDGKKLLGWKKKVGLPRRKIIFQER